MRIMQGIVMKKRSLIRIPIDRIWPNLTDRPPFFEGEIT
jgi:hypothetical protein